MLHANCFFTHFGIFEGSDAFRRDLDKLEKWPNVSIMKFNKTRSCTWAGVILNISRVERDEWTGSSCEDYLGTFMHSQAHIGCEVSVRVCSPECQLRHGLPQKQRDQLGQGGEAILPLCSLIRPHLEHCISSGAPNRRRMWPS